MLSVRSLFLALALASTCAATQVVFVAPNGSDATGDGSLVSPFRSLARALLEVDPGGTIRVAAGAYPFAATIQIPVTIEAFGAGRPIIGPGPTPGATLTIDSSSDVVLRDLDLSGPSGHVGVRITGSSHRVTIFGCTFDALGGNAIEFAGPTSVDSRIERCTFRNVHDQGTAACVAANSTTRLTVLDSSASDCDFGIILDDAGAARIESCAFVDLTQSALVASASPDLLVRDLRASRCAQLVRPTAVGFVAGQAAAVTVTALSHRAWLERVLVEDCGGYTGRDSHFASYDGLFGIGVADSDDVALADCSLHRNEFGGLSVVGASAGFAVHGTSFVGNGWKNGPGEDVALFATVGSLDASDCFFGLPVGPVFDGAGVGNGIAGGAIVSLAPIATRPPASSAASSVVFHSSLPGGLRGRALGVADVDGDARGDVLALEDVGANLRVHLRLGNGFAAATTTWVGGTPIALATGDFDLDSFLDVAIVDETGDRVVVMFGDGNGQFPRRSDVATARRPLRMRAAELDGNPGADLVVACAGDLFQGGATTLLVNDGSGDFTASTLAGSAQPTDVECIDLNADSRLDVIAYDTDRNGAGLRIWRNLGAGSFAAVVQGPVDPGPVIDGSLTRVDLDGLGARDLAVARFSLLPGPGTTRLELFRNSGGGGLLGPTTIDEVLGPAEMASTDIGDRGRARLVVALPAVGEVRAYGPFEPGALPSAPYAEVLFDRPYPQTIAVGELTDDAADDFVVADAATGDVEIWRGRLTAYVSRFGTGCTSTLGTPRSVWRSVPELGAASFGVGVEQAAPLANAVLLISVLPAAVPIDGGCSLLVQPDPFGLNATCDATGFASLPLGVPIDAGLLRGELFVQWWILDPGGAAFGALTASDALRIHVGG